MTAPAPSPAEQAVIDRFGIFEPEARVIEEVAPIVLNALLNLRTDKGPYSGEAALDAAAAVAGYRAAQDGGAEEAVRRVEALAREWETEARQWLDQASENDHRGFPETALAQRDNACEQFARAYALRTALAPQVGDGAR